MGLPADKGVLARAGEDGPENMKFNYYYTVKSANLQLLP